MMCRTAAATPVEKTKYGQSGLRIECRPDPLWFRENPDAGSMEKAFGEAGVQARWVSVVDPTGSPVYRSSFIPTTLDRLDEREAALKEWVDEIHARGMAAMSWYPLILCRSGKTLRPEWAQVPIVEHPPGMHRECNCCFNTGYGDALIEFACEAIEKFNLDGFWFDGSAWTQIWDRPIGLTCACEGCRALFKKQTGRQIPTKIDWDDDTFRMWVAWRFDTFAGYIGRLAAGIRKRHPNAAVVVNHYHRPVVPWQSAIPLNPYDADIITGSEASGEPGADLVSRLCRAYGRAQSEVWMPLEFGPDPETNPLTDRNIHHALTCITAGAMPSYGMGPDVQHAPPTAKILADTLNRLRPYVGGGPVKYAALHLSQQTETFWFGRAPRGQNWAPEPYWQSIIGWTQELMKMHIPPDLVYDRQLGIDVLHGYKVLFMPLSFALSDRQCAEILEFARQGGTVICGPAAGELDEFGRKRPANPLAEALGFRFNRVPAPSGLDAVTIRVTDGASLRTAVVAGCWSVPELTGDGWTVFARGGYGSQSGPLAARRRFGRGEVVVLGADLGGAACWAAPVAGGDTSIEVTEETAFSGRRSLKFTDGPDAPREFYPDLEIKFPTIRPPDSLEIIFSCALRVEQGAEPRIEMRAWENHIGPSLKAASDGKLYAAEKALCDIPTGEWFRLAVKSRLAGDRTFDVTVTLPGRGSQTFGSLPYPSSTFTGSDWIVIYGAGTAKGVFYIDDFRLAASAGGADAAESVILDDDFENTPVGSATPASVIPDIIKPVVDPAGQPVFLHGPAEVRMGAFRGRGSEIIVHLHNTAGSRSKPAQGAPMTLTAPAGIKSARLALSGRELSVVERNGRSVIEVPPVAMHEVVVLSPRLSRPSSAAPGR